MSATKTIRVTDHGKPAVVIDVDAEFITITDALTRAGVGKPTKGEGVIVDGVLTSDHGTRLLPGASVEKARVFENG